MADRNKPVVRGQRRRRGTDSAVPRQRVEAPRREGRAKRRTTTPSYGSDAPYTGPTSGGGLGGGSIGSLLGGLLGGMASGGGVGGRRGGCSPRTLLVVVGLVLAFVCVLVLISQCGTGGLGGLGDLGLAQPTAQREEDQQPEALPTANVRPTRSAVLAGPTTGESWLVMLYQDADDRILEKDIYLDLNEAELVGSSSNVRIVTQIDRYAGGFADDGDWTGTRRYLVQQGDDLYRVESDLVADLGELNMAEAGTLVDFVTWAAQTYPSDRYALIMSDHGMGWPGGWSDPEPASRGEGGSPLASALGNQFYLDELDGALQAIRNQTEIEQFDLVGLDACLMGQIEVYSMLAPHAHYAVASEETEPALGWAYASFLGDLASDPAMDGAELGRRIVSSYVRDDQRIVDTQARADMLRQGSPLGGLFGGSLPSSEQVASQMGRSVTLSAIDLAAMPALAEQVNALTLALQSADQRAVAQARTNAQAFTSVFGQQAPASYVDLGHLAELLAASGGSSEARQAATNVLSALEDAVIAETHGSGKPGATGMAIYFPNSQLYRAPTTGPASYGVIAGRFTGASLWDDYLAYHYTGRAFTANAVEAVIPEEGTAVTAPGQGAITMTPVQASSTVAAPGSPVLLSSDITAQNLGYVLLFTGYYDAAANSLFVADMDYIEAAETREVGGVYYPVWPEGAFTLEFEWDPIVYQIYDGQDAVSATLTPQTYGRSYEEAVYTVDGIYTYGSGEGGSRYARLYFQNGALQQVFGYTGEDFSGAPWEIQPETGDTFTVLEEWLDLDEQGRVAERAYEQGGTLTFRDRMFTWVEMDAAAGQYVVGFITRDMDGNEQQAYTEITVQ
ncbi:MAG: clostripain-related cysteine peptidase [Anaerolineae bacterium]